MALFYSLMLLFGGYAVVEVPPEYVPPSTPPPSEITEEPTLSDYTSEIEYYAGYFEVSFAEHISEPSGTPMKRVDVKNISVQTFNWVKLTVVHADAAGKILLTDTMGIYSEIAPNAAVSKYFTDLDPAVTRAYVVDFVESNPAGNGSIQFTM